MLPGIERLPLAPLFQSLRSLSRCPARTCTGLPLLLSCCLLNPLHAAEPGLDRDCVLRLAETGKDAMTLADVRLACRAGERSVTADPPEGDPDEERVPGSTVTASWLQDDETAAGLVERRLEADREAASRPFSIMAHKPNYFLAAAYNTRGWSSDAYREETGDEAYSNDDLESQFQVSLKVPLAVGLMGGRMDLYGAYTNRSFWQVYNRENSEPFRETNHEPEVWLQFRNDWSIWGFTNSVNTVGWVHQSNGQSGLQSRSWDRLYATLVFERAHWALAFKPWLWASPDKGDGDNPDIDRYMGHGEFRAIYGRRGHVLSLMLRNHLESGFDRGATELSWSFPVFGYPYLRGYVQYFYGYGESLIDYNNKVNRLGVGISVTDWLD
jgi:phospholipase A1